MSQDEPGAVSIRPFSTLEKDAVYRAIESRRDVRSQFVDRPLEDDILRRLLRAAHSAPSVGLTQPWDFIVIRSEAVRREVHRSFSKANEEAAAMMGEEKEALYRSLKLEGVLSASVNLCVTCDPGRSRDNRLGQTHNRDMGVYSTVCAIHNLWLSACAEGVGVGWLSIYHEADLKALLNIPDTVQIVGYLCIGHIDERYQKPELEIKGWATRDPLDSHIHYEGWQNAAGPTAARS